MPYSKAQRGDIFLVDLDPGVGSEQKGKRPVLILQNNIGNKYSPTIIIAPITSYISKTNIPTHVKLKETVSGLKKDSIVLLEQLRTIDKSRIISKIGSISKVTMLEVEKATKISLGLDDNMEV